MTLAEAHLCSLDMHVTSVMYWFVLIDSLSLYSWVLQETFDFLEIKKMMPQQARKHLEAEFEATCCSPVQFILHSSPEFRFYRDPVSSRPLMAMYSEDGESTCPLTETGQHDSNCSKPNFDQSKMSSRTSTAGNPPKPSYLLSKYSNSLEPNFSNSENLNAGSTHRAYLHTHGLAGSSSSDCSSFGLVSHVLCSVLATYNRVPFATAKNDLLFWQLHLSPELQL